MSSLIRLIYASTTTNPIDTTRTGVQTDIGRILMQSRRNNPRRNIGGVLYFRNNYFLQCLEGEEQAVKEVYNKLSKDPRHSKVRIMSAKRVDRRMFTDWSMKYVANEENIARLLKLNGYDEFVPYAFDEEIIDRLLGLFVLSKDPTENTVAAEAPGAKSHSNQGFFTRLINKIGLAA